MRGGKTNSFNQEYLQTILHYNEKNGVFIWKNRFDRDLAWNRKNEGKRAGNIMKGGYWQIGIKGKSYYAHRLAWLYVNGVWPINDIDHINGKRNDNRIENLRSCTRIQNCLNRSGRSSNSSGYKGVYWHNGAKKWTSTITYKGIKKYLGVFESKEDARIAYLFEADQKDSNFTGRNYE